MGPEAWAAIGQAADSIVGAGMGMITAGWDDRRTVSVNKKLQRHQRDIQKELGEFNQGLALDMWDKTGYGAQRKQMEAAGLNPGLMYGGAGSGGTTQGGAAGSSVSSGYQPASEGPAMKGAAMGMEMGMATASIDLMRANAAKARAEAKKLEGPDTENVVETTGNIKQDTANKIIENEILQIKKATAGLEQSIQQISMSDVIGKIEAERKEAEGRARSAAVKAGVEETTMDEAIKQIEQTTTEQKLRMGAIKAGILQTQTETEATRKGIEKMAAEIVNMKEGRRLEWERWGQEEKERWIKEKAVEIQKQQMEFNTSTAAQIKQWTSIIDDIIGAAKAVTPAGQKPYSPY